MPFRPTLLPLAALLLCGPSISLAQDSPWSLRAGPTHLSLRADTELDVGGANVPGAAVKATGRTVAGLELARQLDSHWTARLALGLPLPETTLQADGSLKALVPPLTGTLGRVQYAPFVLTATWSPGRWAGVSPYVGAGLNRTHVTRTEDGDIADLQVDDAWGSVLQGGASWAIDGRWSLFADVRSVRLKTEARGRLTALGGAPTSATMKIRATIVNVGVEYRL